MTRLFLRLYTWFDYSLILPLIALLPIKIGRRLASLRGTLYFKYNRDWRTFTFGDNDLFDRTFKSYRQIRPKDSEPQIRELVRQRYIYQSLEEYEAHLVINGRFQKQVIRFENTEPVKHLLTTNANIVFITGHFGASLEAVTQLKYFGVPVLGMSSSITRDDRVHPSITRFYDKKYRAIAKYLNGGDVIDIEGNAKQFYRFLRQQGSLIIIADLPPASSNEEPIYRRFFHEDRGFASGPTKLAQSANTQLVPFVCFYENGGYVMRFGAPGNEPYQFLEQEFGSRPHMWWAADILPLLPIKEPRHPTAD